MQTWTDIFKTLVSAGFGAILGFVLALLAEPLKNRIQHRIAQRRVEHTLTDEINSLALAMQIWLGARQKGIAIPDFTQKPQFNTERYDFVYEKERGMFYQVSASDSISCFYSVIKGVAAETKQLSNEQVMQLLIEFSLLEDRIRQGLFGRYFRQRLVRGRLSFLTKLLAEFNWKQFSAT
jgi:hypothetical protein